MVYYLKMFKKTDTVIFKKLKKRDYILLKIYRPIILLNTLSKVLESLINLYLSK